MNHDEKASIDLRTRDDIASYWRRVRLVPGRTEGRTHRDEERYCLGLYLRALSNADLLALPLSITEGESPEFILLSPSSETLGVEVTRATTEAAQRQNTEMEKAHRKLQAQAAARGGEAIVTTLLARHGWAGDEPEQQWCSLVRAAIEAKTAKLPKYRPATHHELVIYDDTPLPAVDRRMVLERLREPVRTLCERKKPSFRTISVIVSLDLLYDLGGEPRIIPFIDWLARRSDAPDDFRHFAEDVAFGGKNAVDRAFRGNDALKVPFTRWMKRAESSSKPMTAASSKCESARTVKRP